MPSTAFHRDRILRAVEEYIPSLLPFVHSSYSSSPVLMWYDTQILSAEGIQQGDPLCPMLFCLGIHKLISALSSEFNVFYHDDGTIGRKVEDLQAYLRLIENQGKALWLFLNVDKSELISHSNSTFQDYRLYFGASGYTSTTYSVYYMVLPLYPQLVSRVQSPYYIILALHKRTAHVTHPTFLACSQSTRSITTSQCPVPFLASGNPPNYDEDTHYSSPQGPASTTGKQEESFRLAAVFLQRAFERAA